jgi:hypothetical protein
VGDVLGIILNGLEEGQIYYVTATAYDSAGVESDFSNEVRVFPGSTLSRPGGLVAAYSFDEGSGITAADMPGNGNDGVISGAVWTSSGRFGNTLLLDGVDDAVTIEDSPSLHFSDGFMLSAWVFPGAMQSSWRTILQKDLEAYYLDAGWDEGALYPAGGGTFDGTSAYVTVPEELPLDTWSYLVVTYDGTMLRLYINNEEGLKHATDRRPQANANPLQIGGRRLRDWQAAGGWDDLPLVLLDRLGLADHIDGSRASLDSGTVPAPRGGQKTGPNPTDRSKSGSKRHLVVDRQGVPLAISHTAANVHDSPMLETMIDAIPAILRPRGRPRQRPQKLHADKGYDYPRCHRVLKPHHIVSRITRQGIDSSVRLGRYRWVVESSHL